MTDESPWTSEGVGGITDRVRRRLERTARELAVEWGVSLGEPFAWARYSYVAPAGDDAVLKVAPVEDDEADHEPDALALWNGEGAVRLLRHDRGRRAMLIERARPGNDASGLADPDGLRVAAAVALRLWISPGTTHPFRWIGGEVDRWLARAPDHEIVNAARAVFARMRVPADTLLHGDFHHYNVLSHGSGWVAIDPKPYVGEPEYDVAPLFWNPTGVTIDRARAGRVIEAFASMGLDPDKIRDWAIVRGSYLGFPLAPHETEETSPQLRVARLLL